MKQSRFRKTLMTVHLWAGIILCIPLVLIGLSGSALLVQREILRFQVPSTALGQSQSITRMIAAAQATMPPNVSASWIDLPEAAGKPAAVQFEVSRRPRRTIAVYVDPVSLETLGSYEVVRRGRIMTMFTDMHEFLMLPPHIGLRATGWMGVAMVLMGLSGMVLWWPRPGKWRAAFTVRRGARGIRLQLDLHHAIGIWGLAMFLFLGFSGMYLTFPETFAAGVQLVLPGRADAAPDQRVIPVSWPKDADEAVRLAAPVVPNVRVLGVQLPGPSGTRYAVEVERKGWRPNFPPVAVTFDSLEPGVLTVDDPRTYAAVDRFVNMQYALHFSTGIGWLWTLLVFLSGLTPLALAITGVTAWWMKRAARKRERPFVSEEIVLVQGVVQ